jgi:hypothetical protein
LQLLLITSVLLSTAIGTIVGVKLLRLSSRTRQFSEFAIGFSLFCYAAIGQTTLFASHALGDEASTEVRIALRASRFLAYYIALLGLSAFTWRVFGAESRWRLALTALIGVTAAVTIFASFWANCQQLAQGGELPMYGRYAGSPQFIVMFAWMSIESLVYCSKLRKRHALGHFEPSHCQPPRGARHSPAGTQAGRACALVGHRLRMGGRRPPNPAR